MDIDFDRIKKEVLNCCKTSKSCPVCAKKDCLVGFSKIVLDYYFESKNTILHHAMEKVPKEDFKSYRSENLIDAIVEILLQCRQCDIEHERNCVVNVTRICMETALLGKNMGKYEGNSLSYIIRVIEFNPEIGNEIMGRYKEAKSIFTE